MMKSMKPLVSIQRKPRMPIEGLLCSFPHRTCTQERLDGYDFCLKHILEDKAAPFKQCNYVSNKTGKRCSNAAPKTDRKDGYCLEHGSRALAIRQRAHRRRRPKESAETLLSSMEHYVSSSKGNGGASASNGGMESRRMRGAESVANRALEYATSSESESECPLVDQAWRGDCDSDAESVDSEHEDPLKHAGIYTAEEVALIARDKLIRLQSLYIDQFKRLQHLMKEKRRRYLHHVKTERDAFGGIHVGEDDPRQRKKYERLQATMRYHHRYGIEALVHRQSKERRIVSSEGANYKPPAYPKCIHQKEAGAAKCGARAIPLSKFCLQHIEHDPHQVLYQTCGFAGECSVPVAKLFPNSACPLHTPTSHLDQRYPRPVVQEEEEEEDEEMKEEASIDVVGSPEVKFDLAMDTDQSESELTQESKCASTRHGDLDKVKENIKQETETKAEDSAEGSKLMSEVKDSGEGSDLVADVKDAVSKVKDSSESASVVKDEVDDPVLDGKDSVPMETDSAETAEHCAGK